MNIEQYLNFEYIDTVELKGKVIKDISEENFQQYVLVLTEDNKLCGYKQDCAYSDPYDDDDIGHFVMIPLEYDDVIEYIKSDPYRHFIRVNNLVNNVDELYSELMKLEELEYEQIVEQRKKERYQEYLRLKKEFQGK